jgi:hypothetical protein
MTSFHCHVRWLDTSISQATSKSLAERLAPVKCRIERCEKSRIAEWLEEALHRTLFEYLRTETRVAMSSNEDDGNLLPAPSQFALKIGPGHPWHGDVENQALGLTNTVRCEKLLRGRKGASRKAELPEQVR